MRATSFRVCTRGFTAATGMLGLSILGATPRMARALTFNFTFDASVPADARTATQYVADELSALYTDNVTLNIKVNTDPTTSLAYSSVIGYGPYSYTQVRNALIADARSGADMAAVATLGTLNPAPTDQYVVPAGEIKALGLFDPGAGKRWHVPLQPQPQLHV
jgi:hypothetical protein